MYMYVCMYICTMFCMQVCMYTLVCKFICMHYVCMSQLCRTYKFSKEKKIHVHVLIVSTYSVTQILVSSSVSLTLFSDVLFHKLSY